MMFMSNPDPTDHTPILIEVANGRWDAYGPVTLRSQYLINILNAQGGVNESVPDGTYHFNVLEVMGEQVASLTPALP